MAKKLKVGDVIKVSVLKFGNNGDPLIKYHGAVIFLKGTEKKGFELGRQIEIKITKVYPSFLFAEKI